MKKILPLFLAAALMLSLAACGGGGDTTANGNGDTASGGSNSIDFYIPAPFFSNKFFDYSGSIRFIPETDFGFWEITLEESLSALFYQSIRIIESEISFKPVFNMT